VLDARSSGTHRPRATLSILAVFAVGLTCGVVATLLLTGNHDEVRTGGTSLGRILSATPMRLEEDREAKRRLNSPGVADIIEESSASEHSESHGTGHDSHTEEGHKEHHGYLSLFFLLSTVAFGCVLQVAQERILPCVPYTCMLFFTGIIIAVVHYLRARHEFGLAKLDNWHDSVDMWENIDPHLIFYIFLPALIFAEAMKMKIKLFGRLLKQVLLLAGPGVLIGTVLTATFAKYCLPYGWDWQVSLMFGSILAATDPVAVVALFNTLGVSPRLTMLISGESLINDGTAIVIFTLLLPQVCEHIDVKDSGPWGISLAIMRLTLLAVVLGAVIASVFLVVIFGTASSGYHSDAMIQVAVTICCAFLSFFLAETELSTSGVLSVVSSGLVFAYAAWPRFANRETIHTVWEFIEFIGNTVIFLLAGLLFGDKCMKSYYTRDLELTDLWWLLVVYLAATVIRTVMMALLLPLLNCMGQRITWKEALVMVWSGLRGAVGLVLAIIVDLEFNVGNNPEQKTQGAKILFHVGGMAMLTVAINAPLTAPLLRKLRLTRPPLLEDEVTDHFEKELNHRTALRLQDFTQEMWFNGANREFVSELVPPLGGHHEHRGLERISENISHAIAKASSIRGQRFRNCKASHTHKLERYREVFMRAVQHHYWLDIEGGVVNRASKVARILLYSTDHCLDEADQPLTDWDILKDMLNDTYTYGTLAKCWHTVLPHCQMLEHFFPSPSSVTLWKVYASLAYMKAHQAVRREVHKNLPLDSVLDATVQDEVHRESAEQEGKAFNFLNSLPRDAVEHGKSRMLAGRLLHMQIEDVRQLQADGFLSDKGASHILHEVQEAQRENQAIFYDADEDSLSESDDDVVMAPLNNYNSRG